MNKLSKIMKSIPLYLIIVYLIRLVSPFPFTFPVYWISAVMLVWGCIYCGSEIFACYKRDHKKYAINVAVGFVAFLMALYFVTFSVWVSYEIVPDAKQLRVRINDDVLVFKRDRELTGGRYITMPVFATSALDFTHNQLSIKGGMFGRVMVKYRGKKVTYSKYGHVKINKRDVWELDEVWPDLVYIDDISNSTVSRLPGL